MIKGDCCLVCFLFRCSREDVLGGEGCLYGHDSEIGVSGQSSPAGPDSRGQKADKMMFVQKGLAC